MTEARNDLMVTIGVEQLYVKTIKEANSFVNKWLCKCENDKYLLKYLKLTLESIRRRYLEERYSYEKTGYLSEYEENILRKEFHKSFDLFEPLILLVDAKIDFITLSNSIKQREYKEKDMQNDIIKNFNLLFPQYNYVTKEYKTKNHGFIDILAKDNKSKRDVIIELKVDNKNPNRQLTDYAKEFDNPILVGITQQSIGKKREDNIIYYVFNSDNCTIVKD